MGVFVNILAAPGRSEADLRQLMAEGGDPDWMLEPEEFFFWQTDRAAAVCLNDHCAGYAEMTAALSRRLGGPLLLAWVYDDDAWGYDCFTNGEETDCFCVLPDFLEDVTPEERQRLRGRAEVLAPLFQVDPEAIRPFLRTWSEEEEEEDADCWEMADFLAALGVPLPEEDSDAEEPANPPAPAPVSAPAPSAASFSPLRTRVVCLCADWAAMEDHSAVEQSVQDLLSQASFQAALDSPEFLKELLRGTILDAARPKPFLQGLLDLVRTRPQSEAAAQVLDKLEYALQEQSRILGDLVEAVPEKLPGLSNRPFFSCWLSACLATMGNDQGLSTLPLSFRPNWSDWGLRFLGTDPKTGRPGCKIHTILLDGAPLELHFHLRYLEYWQDGVRITHPFLSMDQLLALPEGDDFFYLLPLVQPEPDPIPQVFPILLQRLPAAASFLAGDPDLPFLAFLLTCSLMQQVEDTEYLNGLADDLYDLAEADPDLDPIPLAEELDAQMEPLYAGQDPRLLLARLRSLEAPTPSQQLLAKVLTAWEAEDAFPVLDPRRLHQDSLLRESTTALYRVTLAPYQDHFRTWVEVLVGVHGIFEPQRPEDAALSTQALDLPATPSARETLLASADALLDQLTSSQPISALHWPHLPDRISAEKDSGEAQVLTDAQITRDDVLELLCRYGRGTLRRLELTWTQDRSLVLWNEPSGYFCFAFDDRQGQDYAMIANRNAYMNVDSSLLSDVPVGLWTVAQYLSHPSPDPILSALDSAVDHLLSPEGLQLHAREMSWSYLRGIISYRKPERYCLQKRLLGGFPLEQAVIPLGTPFFLGRPPCQLVAQRPDGGLETIQFNQWNKNTAGREILPLLQKRFVRLVLHFENGDHLLLLREGDQGAIAFLRDGPKEAWFCTACPEASSRSFAAIAGYQVPDTQVFPSMEALRGELELLLARLDDPAVIFTKNPAWVLEPLGSPDAYHARQETMLRWAKDPS